MGAGINKKREPVDPALVALAERARKGDRAVLGNIYDLTNEKLFRFCLFLSGNPDTAQELCQETFLKAFTSIDKLKEPAKIHGWLGIIARNLFYDNCRNKKETMELTDQALNQLVLESLDSDARLEITETQKALSELSPDDRVLLIMFHVEEYTAREVGELIGITEGLVRNRAHMARKRLQEILARK